MMRHKSRLTLGLLTILTLGVLVSLGVADDDILPADAVLSVHVDSAQSLYESPLIQDIWERLQNSPPFQESRETVESERFQEVIAALENRLGRSGEEILYDLTAGGVDFAVRFDGGPQLILIAHTTDEATAAELVDVAIEFARAEEQPGESAVKVGEHRGITGYRIGDMTITHAGPHLLVASNTDLIKVTIDRLLDSESTSAADSRAADSDDDRFDVSARLDLSALRNLPNVMEGLKQPSEDAGAVMLIGGWFDQLRRQDTATFDFNLHEDKIDAVLRFGGADDPTPSALAGFWADADGEHPAALLNLPGVIYSTSWYRDYAALWESRDQLVTANVVKEMEIADDEAAAQFESLGSAVRLSEIVEQFGPRFRVVVAEQSSPPYDIELRNLLPAAALVIELKDEATFREISEPLARVVQLIVSFEQKITAETFEHNGAELTQLSLPHTAQDIARRDLSQYNLRTTHTINRGHFIIGSTPEIVRQVVDAIDAEMDDAGGGEAAEGPSNTDSIHNRMTSQQKVDVPRVAEALDRVRDAIVRRSVLDTGIDVETADENLDLLISILRLFDQKTITGVFTDDGFEHRATITTSH